jgi:O-antigen/teichoic acid export membrane protein
MFLSRALRTLVAAAYFTLLARALGVSGYGAFSGVCALAGILAPFASLGSGNLLIQAVARDRGEFPARWARCLVLTCVSGSAFTVLSLLLAPLALPRSVSLTFILCIAIAELLFARLLDVAGMAFQAIEQLHVTAWFSLALSLCRMFAAAVLLLLSPKASGTQWSALYLVSTIVPCSVALWLVAVKIEAPRFELRWSLHELLQGTYFSISHAAQTIYNDVDKTMLARISGLGAAGIYGAAYRILEAAFSPVASVLAATYPRFFQDGAQGLHVTASFARRLLSRAAIYSIFAAAAIWIAAPSLPLLVGTQFNESVWALRWLAPLLLLRSLHYPAADSLTGAGYQGTRTLMQLIVAAVNIALNLFIIPIYSWRGAVCTSLISDALLALLLWIAVWRLCRREAISHLPLAQNAMVEA